MTYPWLGYAALCILMTTCDHIYSERNPEKSRSSAHFRSSSKYKVRNDFLHLLNTEDGKGSTFINMTIGYNISQRALGHMVDHFLMTKPWWTVKIEPYIWQNDTYGNRQLVLGRHGKNVEDIYRKIVTTQFPSNCNQMSLSIELTKGFDSFGNYFYNYVLIHKQNLWGVFLPYIFQTDGLSVSFLDDNFCPQVSNKFLCAFLPPTNCTTPTILSKCKTDACVPRGKYFSNATAEGEIVSQSKYREIAEKANKGKAPIAADHRLVRGFIYWNLFSKTGLQQREYDLRGDYDMLFGYSFLFRLNYQFRSLVAQEIYRYKSSLSIPFPSNGDCVAIHIRRDIDRVIKVITISRVEKNHRVILRPRDDNRQYIE